MLRLEQTGLNSPPGSCPRSWGWHSPEGCCILIPAAGQGCTTDLAPPGCFRPPRMAQGELGGTGLAVVGTCCARLWGQGMLPTSPYQRAATAPPGVHPSDPCPRLPSTGGGEAQGGCCLARKGGHGTPIPGGTGTPTAPGYPLLARWVRTQPSPPGPPSQRRAEPCASPRDCDKHYTEAVNV